MRAGARRPAARRDAAAGTVDDLLPGSLVAELKFSRDGTELREIELYETEA